MAGTTGAPGNIPLFDDDSDFTPIQNPFNSISNALNTALATFQAQTYLRYPTKVEMDAVPGTDKYQFATVYGDPTTNNNGDYRWDGTVWKLYATANLRSFTPLWTNFTVGTTVITASYMIQQGVLFGFMKMVLGSGWFISGGAAEFDAPITPAVTSNNALMGQATYLRQSLGIFVGGLIADSTGAKIQLVAPGGSGAFWSPITATSPASFDNGDIFTLRFSYQV